jgi:hypothetical protein
MKDEKHPHKATQRLKQIYPYSFINLAFDTFNALFKRTGREQP